MMLVSIEQLNEIDSPLSAQFRLALASPLWKELPYGLQFNPRHWQFELLEVQPRRLFARIVIPWRQSPLNRFPPLTLGLLLWRADQAPALHRMLTRQSWRTAKPSGVRRSRVLFYDALSHGLVSPYPVTAQAAHSCSLKAKWARRVLRLLLRRRHDLAA